jgi:hypothetical protein
MCVCVCVCVCVCDGEEKTTTDLKNLMNFPDTAAVRSKK